MDANLIFGIFSLGCGIYSLYNWYRLHHDGRVPANSLILTRERTMDNCLDPEGFKEEIEPKLLIFSVLLTILGALNLGDACFGFLTALLAGASNGVRLVVQELLTSLLPLAVVIWFGVILGKLGREYWT